MLVFRLSDEFVASLGSAEKPMTADEFIEFWDSLSRDEKEGLLEEWYYGF